MEERAARHRLIINEDDALGRLRRRPRRSETRRSRTDDEHIGGRIHLRAIGLWLNRGIEMAKTGHVADTRLVRMPVRPQERLVVEAGRNEAMETGR